MGEEMNAEISRFADDASQRKLVFLAAEGHTTTRAQVDQVETVFRQECEQNPEIIKLVGIYQRQGRLALDIYAAGSEAVLHQKALEWGALMYPEASSIPKGHEWSIDAPASHVSVMVQ